MEKDHQLKSITIEGFRSIKKQTVVLAPINVLIGANGSGKSNLVEAFRFLHRIILRELQSYVAKHGGADELMYMGMKATEEILFSLNFDPNYYKIQLKADVNSGLYIDLQYAGFRPSNARAPVSDKIASQGGKESLLDKANGIGRYVYDAMYNWRHYHFHDTSATAKVKGICQVADNIVLAENADNLAAILLKMRVEDKPHFDRILGIVQQVLPYIGSFVLEPEGEQKEFIRFRWAQKGGERVFGASALSDGSLRFLCLAVLLLQPKLPKLILLDEPELGLHPAAIAMLAGLIRKASDRSQILLATQSPLLVSEFEPDDIIVADRVGDESRFRRLEAHELDAWLDEYSLGEIWEKNIVGGQP